MPLRSFQDTLAAAIEDVTDHGFDSMERIQRWTRELELAAERQAGDPEMQAQQLRDALAAIYKRNVDDLELLQHHEGEVPRFTIEKVRPRLRAELDRRIQASAELIKRNRKQAIEETLQRFQGWSTSIPPGGAPAEKKSEIKAKQRKALKQLPFEERRVLIDQGHKLVSALSEIVAADGGAIAGRWRSHWRQAGYDYREDHKERDDKVYAIRDSWAHRAGLMGRGGRPWYDEITVPGQEPFCRCLSPDTQISYATKISAISRRRYDGPCVGIVTAAFPERPLVVTPNHPVLTERGWVAAEELNAGDHLVEFFQQNVSAGSGIDDENHSPSTVAEIFDSAAKTWGIRTVRDSRLQFHGDGTADGNVDIVRPDRSLSIRIEQSQSRKKFLFPESDWKRSRFGPVLDMAGRLFSAAQKTFEAFAYDLTCLLSLFLARVFPAPARSDSFVVQNGLPLLVGPLAGFELGSVDMVSDFDPDFSESTTNGDVVDLELFCQRYRISAGQVRLTKIVDINVQPFSGHVYNLQTSDGWYCANRIISHNCYYTYLYNLRDLPEDMLTRNGRRALVEVGQHTGATRAFARSDSASFFSDFFRALAEPVPPAAAAVPRAVIEHVMAFDRMGYCQHVRGLEFVPDRDRWHGQEEHGVITLEEKFRALPPVEQAHVLMHEVGHVGQEADPDTWSAFKSANDGTLRAFVSMANPAHLNDYRRSGHVDGGVAPEVFAESYARFCLGLPLPSRLADFWRSRVTGLLSPQDARYMPWWPNKPTRCQRCSMFLVGLDPLTNACTVVAGPIASTGHCKLFQIRGARTDSAEDDWPAPKVGYAAHRLRLDRLELELARRREKIGA